MTLLNELYFVAILAIAVLAMFFMFCRHYDDGVVGNFVLGLVMLPLALAELADMVKHEWTAPTVLQQVLIMALAGFLARYAFRVVWTNWRALGAPDWLRKRPVRV